MSPEASADDRQRRLWRLLLRSEAQLRSASQELQALHTEQNNEKKEVRRFPGILFHHLLCPQLFHQLRIIQGMWSLTFSCEMGAGWSWFLIKIS